MGLARFGLACGLLLAAAPAVAADCMKPMAADQTAEGTLVSRRFRDEAYRRTEHAYILNLHSPACLDWPGEYDKVPNTKRIHLFPADEATAQKMRSLIGKRVRARGEPFGEHTAHHHAPIVMRTLAIERLN